MSAPEDIAGPVIVWQDYGCEGWHPRSYPTMKDALLAPARSYGPFVVTKLATFDVVDTTDAVGPSPRLESQEG